MKLFNTVDGLLEGTKYLAWGIGVIGIAGSIVLLIANIPLGLGSAAVFLASFFLAAGVALLLLPKQLAKGKLEGNKRYIVGAAAVVIALVIMLFVWNICNGLPAVNLLFV